jgi:hypothetical protein
VALVVVLVLMGHYHIRQLAVVAFLEWEIKAETALDLIRVALVVVLVLRVEILLAVTAEPVVMV